MSIPTTEVRITISRIGKPPRTFTEGLVDDDGMRLRTFSVLPPEAREGLSAVYRAHGRLAEHRAIHSVRKYYFYKEYFGLMELRDPDDSLIGYYCDIVTPLLRQGDAYLLTDLFLDLWVSPEAELQQIDLEEFEAAVAGGLISAELEQAARRTVARLTKEWKAGSFPSAYVQ